MKNSTSLYLDVMRLLAALTVFAGHANWGRLTGNLPFLWRAQNLGTDAVMVFFVLSGFVIAYVSSEKEKTFNVYAASRLARLYSVAIPSLFITAILDFFGFQKSPEIYVDYENSEPLLRIVINLLFLNELWFTSTRLFSNGPYWSLGYEFWYYAIFAASVYLFGIARNIGVVILMLVAGPKILLLFPVWMMGVWAFKRTKERPISIAGGWTLYFSTIVIYIISRLFGLPHLLSAISERLLGDSGMEHLKWSHEFVWCYVVGFLVALNFVGASSAFQGVNWCPARLERALRRSASYTFAIYLFHYPILQFFAAMTTSLGHLGGSKGIYIVLATLATIWPLGALTERLKTSWRLFLLKQFG